MVSRRQGLTHTYLPPKFRKISIKIATSDKWQELCCGGDAASASAAAGDGANRAESKVSTFSGYNCLVDTININEPTSKQSGKI